MTVIHTSRGCEKTDRIPGRHCRLDRQRFVQRFLQCWNIVEMLASHEADSLDMCQQLMLSCQACLTLSCPWKALAG